jgi:UDP-N-acetylglucosamine 2-epimerase (non-hydrolysing)
MENIFKALRRLAEEFPDLEFIFPVHMNPLIGGQARKILGEIENIKLVGAVGYSDMAKLLKLCYAVMTDSGGLQEEAPALNKPVLVLRETTERGEGIDAGTAMLAGGEDEDIIYALGKRLVNDQRLYNSMAQAPNPYGDGSASRKIVDWIEAYHRHG